MRSNNEALGVRSVDRFLENLISRLASISCRCGAKPEAHSMFSEIRSLGPRLPTALVSLPAAIERVGPLVVPGWIGQPPGDDSNRLSVERNAAALASEGLAVANHFEPDSEQPAEGGASCAKCGRPATRVRAGQAYCSKHGKRSTPPNWAAKSAPGSAAVEPRNEVLIASDELRALPDQASLLRWAKAHAALRERVVAGELQAWLREPGGKIVPMSAEEWGADAFPSPNQARARLPSRGYVEMHVIFEAAELDRVFGAVSKVGHSLTSGQVQKRIHEEIERRAKAGELAPSRRKEAIYISGWSKQLKSNNDAHYTSADGIRTSVDFINYYDKMKEKYAPAVEV